jgi:acyl-CoA synthetase (NDP forming)
MKGRAVPHGVAIVGDSENNFWAGHVRRNLPAFGYQGSIWPVNPNYESVAGRSAVASVLDIDGTIDAVVIAVAAHRCPEIVRQSVQVGVEDLVVVADGFAERGPSGGGAELQRDLVAACGERTRLYGPNCIGFADFRRRLCLVAEPIPLVEEPGDISIISQSGALVSALMAAVIEDGGGIDWCVSLGNAAQFDVARAIDYVCRRGTTRSIVVYAEALGGDMNLLRAALGRARDAKISIVMLKAGRSDLATRIAYAHTASVAGDDAQVDAFLRAHGVIRVDSLEDMARTAVLAPLVRHSRGDGVAVIGSSGGQAAIAGDLAARHGMKLARLSAETMAQLRSAVEPGSFIDNPFDLVGRPGAKKAITEVFASVYRDDSVGFTLSPWSVIFPDDSPARRGHRESILLALRTAQETQTPTVIASVASVPWTDWMLELRQARPDVAIVRGIENTIRALSRLFPVTDDVGGPEAGDHGQTASGPVLGEIEGRRVLSELGLPLIQGEACGTADEALQAAGRLRGPLVVKVDVARVAHKAKLGLVALGCQDQAAVAIAIGQLQARLREHHIRPESVSGYLVEEMASGSELLVGLTRADLGLFLTIGVGGVAAAAGTPARTLLLPADDEMLRSVIMAYLALPGSSPGLRDAIRCIAQLCAEFAAGGLPGYETVEINPMMISAERASIVDVLLVPAG